MPVLDDAKEVVDVIKKVGNPDAIILFVSKKTLKEMYYRGSPFLRLIQKEGRLLYMHNSLKDWYDSGLEYRRQAEYLCEGGFYRGACFSSQQAIEKFIKWVLLKKGCQTSEIKKTVIALLKDEKVMLFGSRARGNNYPYSDVDIGILPMGKFDEKKLTLLKEIN